MNKAQVLIGGTLGNSACTPKNHAKKPENQGISKNGGTLGHMRIGGGMSINIEGFLSNLFTIKPSDTPSLVDVPPCAPATPIARPSKPVALDDDTTSPAADPTACLTGLEVTRAFIQEVCPDEMFALMEVYRNALKEYAGSGYGPWLPYAALNSVDTHIRQQHGHQIGIDGMAIGPGDTRLVTGWHVTNCGEKPQTASLPPAGRNGRENSTDRAAKHPTAPYPDYERVPMELEQANADCTYSVMRERESTI